MTGDLTYGGTSLGGTSLEGPGALADGAGEDNPFQCLSRPQQSRIKQVWAIGGGKGGVGKSLIASSLAIALARRGNKVVALDLDLGGANLHTTLGVDLPQTSLSDFFGGRISSLEEAIVPTSVPNLSIISGAQDSTHVANIPYSQKVRLMQHIREIDADYLIFDLGAGSSFNTIDFFLYADVGLLTLLPEPTSIENAYRFIKSAYYRRIKHARDLSDIRTLVEMAMDVKNPLEMRTPSDLFREVAKSSPDAATRLKEQIRKFRPKLIVNQARNQSDVDIGFSVKTVCKRYFGMEMDYVGYLEYENAVWQAVRRKRPLMLEFPNSRLVSTLEKIANFLVNKYGHYRNELF